MKKAVIILLLTALTVSFVACGETVVPSTSEQVETGNSSVNEESIDNAESEVSEEPEFVKSEKRFDNETLTIFGKKDGAHVYSRQQWEYDPETEGDAINNAVYERNEWIRDNYGITIRYIADNSGEYFIKQAVANMIAGGLETCDVVCDGLTTMAALASDGSLYPLNDISENLDLTKPWWDQGVNRELSINNCIYYAAGDILITDDEYTYCILFNKDLMAEKDFSGILGDRSVYDVVRDNDWTYDVMFTVAKECASKTSEGASMTLDDTWGYIGDIGCLNIMMNGGGYRMATKDGNDIPSLNVINEQSTTLFTKLIGYMNDKSYSHFMERFGVSSYYTKGENMFASGKVEFYNVKLSALTTLVRSTETKIKVGVLPIPKASSEQEEYYNSAATLHFSCVGIPSCVKGDRIDMIAACLEALGYLGREKLTGAYIETTLKSKRADKEDDSDMIGLVLTSRSFDIASIYDWGGLNAFYSPFAGTANTDIVSSYEGISGKAQSDLEATIRAFSEKK